MRSEEPKMDISLGPVKDHGENLEITLSDPRIVLNKEDLSERRETDSDDLDIQLGPVTENHTPHLAEPFDTLEFQAKRKKLFDRIKAVQSQFVRPINNPPANFDLSDLGAGELPESAEEHLRRMKLQEELRSLEAAELPGLYNAGEYSSPARLETQHRQQNANSCTVASALNVLRFFGLSEGISEETIAKAVGQSGESAPIDNDHTLSYLEKQGLMVENISSVSEIIKAIEQGGVILFTEPGGVRHRVLISGVDIKNGDIQFFVNDPLADAPRQVPLTSLISKMNYDVEIPSTQAIFR